jgi:hypothetical protein
MGRICAWCASYVNRTSAGRSMPSTHVLCPGCLEELRERLAISDADATDRSRDT